MKTLCRNCETECTLLFVATDCNRKLSKERFKYYVCPDCGLVFLSPIPGNLGDFYPHQYHTLPTSLRQLEAGAEPERYKIELVQGFVKAGRLLEIGPSHGNFAFLAKRAGFEVETIEMDERCCRFLTDYVGVKAFCCPDPVDALKETLPYDVIALWHVIEHLPDPWRTLSAIADRVRHDGIVVIAAPNPASFQFRVLGRRWPHLDAPRHVALIPRQLLVERMRTLGFACVLETTTDRGGVGWNLFGWEVYFRNTLWCFGFRASRVAHGIARLLGLAVAGLTLGIERRRHLGSAYTLVFRKE